MGNSDSLTDPIRMLCHSFTTPDMSSTNVREAQDLFGHKHVENTMVYPHILLTLWNAPHDACSTRFTSIV